MCMTNKNHWATPDYVSDFGRIIHKPHELIGFERFVLCDKQTRSFIGANKIYLQLNRRINKKGEITPTLFFAINDMQITLAYHSKQELL